MHPKIAGLENSISTKERIQKTYDWICRQVAEHSGGFTAPPLREIGSTLGFSAETVRRNILVLARIGLVAKNGKREPQLSLAKIDELPDDGEQVKDSAEFFPPHEPETVVLDELPNDDEAETVVLDELPEVEGHESLEDQESSVVENPPVKLSNEEVIPYAFEHKMESQGQKVWVDTDVGIIYNVSTKRINEARKRNPDKFVNQETGEPWAWQLTDEEYNNLVQNVWSQSATKKTNTQIDQRGRGGENPWVYTLEGIYSHSTILNSEEARYRSSKMISTFSDMNRMAHGEEPVDERNRDLINALAQKTDDTGRIVADTISEMQRQNERTDAILLRQHEEIAQMRDEFGNTITQTHIRLEHVEEDLTHVKTAVDQLAQDKQAEEERKAQAEKEEKKRKAQAEKEEKEREAQAAKEEKMRGRIKDALRVAGRLQTGIMEEKYFSFGFIYAEFSARTNFRVDAVTIDNAPEAFRTAAEIVVDRAIKFSDRVGLLPDEERSCYEACSAYLARDDQPVSKKKRVG